ncbi:hypothetical protein DUD52_01720 [Listeria monocytogenes]|nr:hypothetical protein [Listeria monocytogenes]
MIDIFSFWMYDININQNDITKRGGEMKIQLLLRVPDSMKKDLKEVAERKGMTVNGFVNSELRRILDNELKHTSNT